MSTAPRMLVDWPAFMADPKVKDMPPITRGIYMLLLGAMWMNEAWLKDDDRNIARKLDMDVRTWRSHRQFIEPTIEHKSDPFLGPILQQKRLSREYQIALEQIAKRRAQTAPARAKKAGKPAHKPSVTDRPAKPQTEAVTVTVTDVAAKAETGGNTPSKKDRTLPIKKAESSILPTTQGLGASSGVPNGKAEAAAPVASPSLEGGSLPKPSQALLNSPIVKGTSLLDRINAATKRKADEEGT